MRDGLNQTFAGRLRIQADFLRTMACNSLSGAAVGRRDLQAPTAHGDLDGLPTAFAPAHIVLNGVALHVEIKTKSDRGELPDRGVL